MRCYKCGAKLSAKNYCTSCGADVVLYKRIVRLSNVYYNDGLAKAGVRDLSGAIISLKRCLKFNKRHIMARNLLGLVYYEIGETVSALSQWILSCSLKEEKNMASDYITILQANQGKLDGINQTIHKYNLSLEYCRQGSDDLAIIQLKKLLSVNVHLVKGYQLLGLLYLKNSEYDKATKQFRKALDIDSANTVTLHYMKILSEMNTVNWVKRINMKDGADDIQVLNTSKNQISYRNGNEMIIQPAVVKEHTGIRTMIDIVIGLVVGVALMWFLVMPAFEQSAKNEETQIGNSNYEELQKKNAQVDDLNKQIASLEKELSSAKGSLSGYTSKDTGVVARMEKMLEATRLYSEEKMSETFDVLVSIDRKGLSKSVVNSWQEMYDTCVEQMKKDAEKMYTSGGKAKEAAELYEKMLKIDPKNEELMYHCASAYKKAKEDDKAIAMYTKLMKQSPTGKYASKATAALDKLQPKEDQDE